MAEAWGDFYIHSGALETVRLGIYRDPGLQAAGVERLRWCTRSSSVTLIPTLHTALRCGKP